MLFHRWQQQRDMFVKFADNHGGKIPFEVPYLSDLPVSHVESQEFKKWTDTNVRVTEFLQ